MSADAHFCSFQLLYTVKLHFSEKRAQEFANAILLQLLMLLLLKFLLLTDCFIIRYPQCVVLHI